MAKLKVTQQGTSIYVLGTHDTDEAAKLLPPECVGWAVEEHGRYARRKYGLRFYTREKFPKDALIGIRFAGLRREGDPKPNGWGYDRGALDGR
jgi:hypothetical protein